jgi:hypothetical protein
MEVYDTILEIYNEVAGVFNPYLDVAVHANSSKIFIWNFLMEL